MSFEVYPVKEKLATDRTSQLAWLVREMGYSRDKTKGYEEKLTRLARSPNEVTSVFGFMSNYWHRFRMADDNRLQFEDPLFISKALQAEAKVVAGLSDKVAFSFWLESRKNGTEYDPEAMLDTSLSLISARADELQGQYTEEQLADFNKAPQFEGNPMGQGILALHASYEKDPNDTESLRQIAIDGSAVGILMWQAYAVSLAGAGHDVTMPKPGPAGAGGNIEPWED